MKKTLALIAIAALLTGCASTRVNNLTVANRTVKFNILNVEVFEKTTEGLVVDGAEIIKDASKR